MDEIFSINIDKSSDKPIYKQIADSVYALIVDGTLPSNSKLPPIRKTAAALGVNNVTVVSAYKYL